MRYYKWGLFPQKPELADKLAQSIGESPIIAQILLNRGKYGLYLTHGRNKYSLNKKKVNTGSNEEDGEEETERDGAAAKALRLGRHRAKHRPGQGGDSHLAGLERQVFQRRANGQGHSAPAPKPDPEST